MDSRILDQFRAIVGKDGLITEPEQLRTYECDGLTNFRVVPSAVVLPTSTEQVQGVVRTCHRERIPFVARGSGTGLSGGALPIESGIVISLARLNRILEVDLANARVVVEPGVINGIVTRPEIIQTLLAAFNSTNEAGAAVSGIIAAGMLPAAIEMMDNLAIQAAEAAVHAGYPNCGGLLLVELDGPAAEVELLMAQVKEICTECGAWEIRVAPSEEERAAIWKGRKAAFAAMGRISPNYIVQDGVIPRTALPQVLSEIERLSAEAGLRVANFFHAGDGT